MPDSLIQQILTPFLSAAAGTSVSVFIGKRFISKSIEHTFDKKMEYYKSNLQKENISFQIEKSEFARKKFDLIIALHQELLNHRKELESYYGWLPDNIDDLKKYLENSRDKSPELRDKLSIASLFIDESIANLISQYFFNVAIFKTLKEEQAAFRINELDPEEGLKIPLKVSKKRMKQVNSMIDDMAMKTILQFKQIEEEFKGILYIN
ncbi:hypothetical protein HQ865_05705 [Mucilaginibacter mali]|uniref:Uncharacterized protein n=1 Tax=Mucilaginibacter mali TaxID=2740462 RepID=A0A7D4QQR1_9SPHI|nr:hypothetical protein [Mucilaginibacter mali]QKJ29269.1 hypothetical protein HQ865_05705 [Mucilaginibacter mali]